MRLGHKKTGKENAWVEYIRHDMPGVENEGVELHGKPL